jgi:diaminopimelate epimerase
MRVPFAKAHGAGNDFLLTWAGDAPGEDLPALARLICSRHTGIGADGWMLVDGPADGMPADASVRLFNADGSEPEMSGNGTRCAAAFLMESGFLPGPQMRIATGAGVKHLRLIDRKGLEYLFEMNMGQPEYSDSELHRMLPLDVGMREVAVLSVGNPQCVVIVDDFDFDWRSVGKEIEAHPHFPEHTNVSFVRVVDDHTLEVRFYERGVGETMSSGTGATGAAAAAMLRGLAATPIHVVTPAGTIDLRWADGIYLTGPAVIVAGGEFYTS